MEQQFKLQISYQKLWKSEGKRTFLECLSKKTINTEFYIQRKYHSGMKMKDRCSQMKLKKKLLCQKTSWQMLKNVLSFREMVSEGNTDTRNGKLWINTTDYASPLKYFKYVWQQKLQHCLFFFSGKNHIFPITDHLIHTISSLGCYFGKN